MNGLALNKRRAGERVYNLSAGEPMVGTPEQILAAAREAMGRGETHYQPTPGILKLRESVTSWMNASYGTNFQSSETFITCGGKFSLSLLLHTLVNPGDEVLVVAPYWVSYKTMTEIAGGVPTTVSTEEENQWKVTPEMIEQAVTEKTTTLILNNGANPTGCLYTKEELGNILSVASKYNLNIISDEVYSELVYDGSEYISVGSFGEYRDGVAIVQSASKSFAMTGWRVGIVLGPEELIKKLTAIQSQTVTGTSSISQWAAVGAYTNPELAKDIRNEMQTRRDVFVSTCNTLFSANIKAPASGLYVFVPMHVFGADSVDSKRFCEDVLENANVAMVPGAAFGVEGYVRCSFGETKEEIQAALEALAAYLKK